VKPRIVILGGGFGGAYCAQALERKLDGRQAEIVLLDRQNYFVFYPFLIEAGTGSLAPSHAVVSIRSFLKRTAFRLAEVCSVDPIARRVAYRSADDDRDSSLEYDHLVVSVGSVTRLPSVPGLDEHGFSLKSLTDALALRDRAIRMLERADATTDLEARRRLLSFVVVGGNFTGVEVAGEFQVFLRQASKQYPGLDPDLCHVTLVEIADRILPGLDAGLSRYAVEKMRARGIDVRLRSSVRQVAADHITLANDERLPCRTLIWCAGIAPNPLLERMSLPVDENGYLRCDRMLRVQGRSDIWAIGDCAVNPDREGRPYPATAQHATRQARHLAGNLARVLRGGEPRPFDYTSRGTLVGLGCRTGVAKVLGIKLSGFAAWFIWRTFYLSKLPGISRKLRVALDWTMDLLFQRDHVQLGVHPRRASWAGRSARNRQ